MAAEDHPILSGRMVPEPWPIDSDLIDALTDAAGIAADMAVIGAQPVGNPEATRIAVRTTIRYLLGWGLVTPLEPDEMARCIANGLPMIAPDTVDGKPSTIDVSVDGGKTWRATTLPGQSVAPRPGWAGVGVDVHAAACVDEDGKVECGCGLEDRQLPDDEPPLDWDPEPEPPADR